VIEETREILGLLGIDARRLQLKWISASEGAAFAEGIRAFVELLKELGEISIKN
jgi:coenzyme F420-reducing hydrogenase delta subunit